MCVFVHTHNKQVYCACIYNVFLRTHAHKQAYCACIVYHGTFYIYTTIMSGNLKQ